MFMERIQGELKQLLIPKDRFTPFPRIEDRKWWEAVDPSQSRPILEAAEAEKPLDLCVGYIRDNPEQFVDAV